MKKRVTTLVAFVWLFFVCGATISYAEQVPLITNIDGRKPISLDGRWQIIIDPYETGYYNYRWQPREDGYFKNQSLRILAS